MEEDLVVWIKSKLIMSQQYALAVKRTNCILGGIKHMEELLCLINVNL